MRQDKMKDNMQLLTVYPIVSPRQENQWFILLVHSLFHILLIVACLSV